MAGSTKDIGNHQYSTVTRVRARAEALGQSKCLECWCFAAAGLSRFFFFFDALKFFSRFEADRFAGRDADFFAGAGIAADSGLAGFDAEDAEAAEFNALAAAKSLPQRFEDRLDGLLGLGAANVRRGDDGIYNIQLNHTILPRFRGRC
jgi:hypothetical protein